ncbi:MAG: ribosome small subunit-dependent GTPase A [Candidatus Caenarcaniphilales bacterium]|nr:ribosome small subunit-dependent GTPase A [Candidatus Caenarcaniphilales bacterium]
MSLINEITQQLDSLENHGIVKQIHGHFYYVEELKSFLHGSERNRLLQTKEELLPLTLPTRLKKEKVEAYVGDIVELSQENKIIKSVFKRLSLLSRPKVANVDLAVIVVSSGDPPLESEYLDRLLCHSGLTLPLQPLICITKSNTFSPPGILKEYEDLGYTIVKVSNKTKYGIEELKNLLLNKTSVFAGQSGVGKSSLLNSLFPELNLKVGEVSSKSLRGTHTTRHTQIFDGSFNGQLFHILDTPGFSRLDSQFTPFEIADFRAFPEIALKKTSCQFNDCKHLEEEGCAVRFTESRKASYRKIMEEAKQYEEDQSQTYTKERRESIKSDSNTTIPKLKASYRTTSRKKRKQDFDY